jgi:hypothetical protein
LTAEKGQGARGALISTAWFGVALKRSFSLRGCAEKTPSFRFGNVCQKFVAA